MWYITMLTEIANVIMGIAMFVGVIVGVWVMAYFIFILMKTFAEWIDN